MPIDWIVRGRLVDEGPTTAVYPYAGLKDITTVADCRTSVQNVGRKYEDEFGAAFMTPYYNLLWALNTTNGLCTSHTAFSNDGTQPDFDWATHIFGSLTIIQWRDERQQFDVRSAFAICQFVDGLITSQAETTGEDTKGRRLYIRPVNINHGCYPDAKGHTIGFGCQIIVSGNAGSRLRAAQRWAAAIRLVLAAVEKHRDIKGAVEPHQHSAYYPDLGEE